MPAPSTNSGPPAAPLGGTRASIAPSPAPRADGASASAPAARRRSGLRWLLAAAGVYAALLAAHWPLLHLPYYWDEAGYFVPAALDLFRHGWWVPRTTLANGHPPLFMAALALAWRIFGMAIPVTRAVALAFAAALLLATAQLTEILAAPIFPPPGAPAAPRLFRLNSGWLAAFLLAITPLCFAQSSLAQLDLPAAALGLWALVAWARGRRWAYAALAAAACLTKETAILIPFVLGCCALARWLRGSAALSRQSAVGDPAANRVTTAWPALGPHLIPAAALLVWLAYYHSVTGFWMGNGSFLAYNLQGLLSAPRVAMALALRLWQVAGYDGMAAITLAALLATWLPRRAAAYSTSAGIAGSQFAAGEDLTGADDQSGVGGGSPALGARAAGPQRPQPPLATPTARAIGDGGPSRRLTRELWAILAAYIVFHALVGGAVLARYLLPAIAIYIALLTPRIAAALRPRLRLAVIAAAAAFLIAGWFWNPPYPFPYEDNLAYATFIRLQQRAVSALAARRLTQPVLTAWPASNELTDPDLDYLRRPIPVFPVSNFSAAALAGHRLAPGQYALLYSRIYQPRADWSRLLPFWRRWKRRYFHYAPPLAPGQLLRRLHARPVWRAAAHGQWALLAVGRPPRRPNGRFAAAPPSMRR